MELQRSLKSHRKIQRRHRADNLWTKRKHFHKKKRDSMSQAASVVSFNNNSLLFFFLLSILFYFILYVSWIREEQKRQQQQQKKNFSYYFSCCFELLACLSINACQRHKFIYTLYFISFLSTHIHTLTTNFWQWRRINR